MISKKHYYNGNERELIALSYKKRNPIENIPTEFELKNKSWVEKLEKHSNIKEVTNQLGGLFHSLQLVYYAMEHHEEMHRNVTVVCKDVSIFCNEVFVTLCKCKATYCKEKEVKFCDLEASTKCEILEKFAMIVKGLDAVQHSQRSSVLIKKLDEVINDISTYETSINKYQKSSKAKCIKKEVLSTYMQVDDSIIASKLDFYLENAEEITKQYKIIAEQKKCSMLEEFNKSRAQFETQKFEKQHSLRNTEESHRQSLGSIASENVKTYKMKEKSLSQDLQASLISHQNQYSQQLCNVEKVYSKELDACRKTYQEALQQKEKECESCIEEYIKNYSEKESNLEKEMQEKLSRNKAEFETQLQQSRLKFEKQLSAISWTIFKRNSKKREAENAKTAADAACQKEKEVADAEAMKEKERELMIAFEEKQRGIAAAKDKLRLDKILAENECRKWEQSAYSVKIGTSDKAKQDKLDADKTAESKCKEQTLLAKQVKQTSFQNLEETHQKACSSSIEKSKTEIAKLERQFDQQTSKYKQEDEKSTSIIKTFELKVLMQIVHFQRGQSTRGKLGSQKVKTAICYGNKETYLKAAKYCCRQAKTALLLIRDSMSSLNFFWREMDKICTGTHVSNSRIAKHVHLLQSKKGDQNSSIITIAKLERKHTFKFQADMDEQNGYYTSLFDMCTEAEQAFALIQPDLKFFTDLD